MLKLLNLGFSMPGMWRKRFVKNFQRLLDANDLRAADVARSTGISAATISRWLNGEYLPDEASLDKLTDFYGWDPTELLADVPAKRPEISPHQKQKLRDQIEREIFERLCDAMGFEKPNMTKRQK